MCFFSSDEVTKLELHCGCEHLYGVSPETHQGVQVRDGRTDRAAASRPANPADALSPVCLRAWAMSEDDTEKDMPHRSHWYGRSPVWRRL